VDEEGDVRVRDEVESLFRGGVRGHYYCWGAAVWRGRQVGVVHEGDVGELVGACCEMKKSSIL